MPSAVLATVTARDLVVSFGPNVVLDGASVSITPGSCVGVTGPNGAGKSTLLKAIAGLVTPERGRIEVLPPTANVGYLPQEPDRSATETLREQLARRTGVAEADRALEAAATALADGAPGADDEYAAALDRWMALGGADFDARADAVCAELDLPERTLAQPTATLSGGQAARASLAGILLSRFDVFLLDEPTNDLDFDGLARLERFVTEQESGVAVVSHDRAFLERVVTSVVEVDEHHRSTTQYDGGWLAYLDLTATARRHAEEQYESWKGERERLVDRARTQRQWAADAPRKARKATTDNDKAQRGFKVNRTEKQASKVRQSEKALERLGTVDKPWEGWRLELDVASAPRSGAVVFRLDGAVVDRGDFRLGPLDLEIGWAERVAIVGPNGAGKTTLLSALLGRAPLSAGERWMGPGVVVGELDQSRALFLDDRPLIDGFVEASGLLDREARSVLAKLGLTATHVARPSRQLSPGERTRSLLGLLMGRGANCLVLDEPTNHLDLPAIEQLESALDRFDGTILLVTHDRRLLEDVRVDRTLHVSDGRVAETVG